MGMGMGMENQISSLIIIRLDYKRVSFCISHVGMPFKWLSRTNGVVLTPSRNSTILLLIYSPCSPNPMVDHLNPFFHFFFPLSITDYFNACLTMIICMAEILAF